MAELVLRTGFSPCPNDTFMFFALVAGDVAVPGARFEPWLADIEELNRRALGPDPLPVTKLSVAALAGAADRYAVLPAGAALGHGCGPLVVCRADRALRELADLRGARVAMPGQLTTANLLLRIFAPQDLDAVPMRFDRIMPAVAEGRVDAGVVIHESRFTFRGFGLKKVADLGEVFEAATGSPLPLGVVAARRDLGPELIERIADGLRQSVVAARADPRRSRGYVLEHAQELGEDVCERHIALYVNDFSVDLGATGRRALDELLVRGRAAGFLPAGRSPWLDEG